ncbi:MAG: DUF6778 family protein [Tateyamaria sp.]|uniref:DUF6778 family protein n=2 Tax=Tateyamaria sp. TaxID=1929288 RepID=UPI00329F2D87
MALAAVGALAACASTPQVETSLASTLLVTEVRSSTTVQRTETALPKDQITQVAQAKVSSALKSANPSGSRPVRAEMVVTQFYIANPIAGALLGSSVSSISTEITLVDAATGDVVTPAFKVIGHTEARPTILGAAAIKSPNQELEIITNDLANEAKFAIYGN